MTIFLFTLVLIQITSGLTEELTEELTEGKDQNRLSKGKYHIFLFRSINALKCKFLQIDFPIFY